MTAISFQLFANGDGRLTVGFKPGTKPAGSGLAPGECSWLDRAMREQEPKSICHNIKDVFISTTATDDSRYTPSHIFLIQSVWSKGAPYLEKTRDQNAYFTVMVYNDGAGCLVVTPVQELNRLRPCKVNVLRKRPCFEPL